MITVQSLPQEIFLEKEMNWTSMKFVSPENSVNPAGNFGSIQDGLDQVDEFDSLYNVKVMKQPPENVFSDEWFEVSLAVECVAPHVEEPCDVELKIAASLTKYPDREKDLDGAVLETNPDTITINLKNTSLKSKPTVVKFKITSDVSQHEMTKYSISFTTTSVSPASLMNKVSFGSVSPIQIVKEKIVVDTDKWSPVWFKDEGGKENGIEASVSLRDADDNIVRNRKIPIKVALLYDNEKRTKVMRQDTLRILGISSNHIDPDSGKCPIYFRIEDVSKNHQGQKFKLEIAPDSSRIVDIASTCTPSVSIRSKRNKRKATGGSRRTNFDKKLHQMYPSEIPTGYSKSMPPLNPSGDIEKLRQAMKGVIDWTEQIINGLLPLKWNLIGYAQFPDGTTDFSRPYHNMPNPNDFITRVLSLYSEQTMNHLQLLKTSVENTTAMDSQGTQAMMMSQFHQSNKPPFFDQSQNPMNQGNQYNMTGKMMNPFGMNQSVQFNEENNPPHNFHRSNMSQMPQMHQVSQLNVPTMGSHFQDKPQENPRQFGNTGTDQEDKNPHRVEYVLAKQFKSLFNGSRLGYPAFNKSKVIVGFYKESTIKVGVGRFVSLQKHKNEFGPRQMAQATIQLEDAIENDSSAVHSLREWGSLESMIDHVIVYAWRHDFSNTIDENSPSKNKQDAENNEPSDYFNTETGDRHGNTSFQKSGSQDLLTW